MCEQYVAATRRADTWAAVALYLRNTAAGHTFLEMCPADLRAEVQNPTETALQQAYMFHCSPPPAPHYIRAAGGGRSSAGS